ncbi:MAG TPA: zinc ribbon domain-containing protein [Terriglobales bacterium]|nr:zinc ribbon domain-containing protein [Terriglobales bacterium]
MFCDQCGMPLQADFNVCPKCGKPVHGPGAPRGYAPRLETHLRTLGTLWIILGAIWLLPSLFFITMGHAVHLVMHGWPMWSFMTSPVMFGLGSMMLLVAAGGICVGWGLTRHEPWARIAAIVVGVLAIFHPPFGTLLGIYTLWVLLPRDAAAQYEQMSPR